MRQIDWTWVSWMLLEFSTNDGTRSAALLAGKRAEAAALDARRCAAWKELRRVVTAGWEEVRQDGTVHQARRRDLAPRMLGYALYVLCVVLQRGYHTRGSYAVDVLSVKTLAAAYPAILIADIDMNRIPPSNYAYGVLLPVREAEIRAA